MPRRNSLAAAAAAISRRPAATLLILAVVLLPLIGLGGTVRPDNSLTVWFVEDDPALVAYRQFLHEFGNDEAVLVGWERAGTPGTTPAEQERRLAARLRAIPGVARAVAPAELPAAVAARLISADGRAAAVVVWLETGSRIEAERPRIIGEINAAAREVLGTGDFHLAGMGVLYEGLNRQTASDTGVFLGLALICMLLLLAFTLRSGRAVAVVLIPALVASGASVGVVALSGRPFTVLSSALPTLVLVIALADGIHVLLHYWAVRRESPPVGELVRRTQAANAVAWMAVPCLFTSLTTGAGFLALTTSRIVVVRDFGALAAVAMLLAWLVVIPSLAAALAMWDFAPPARRFGSRWLDALPLWVAGRLPHWRTAILAGAAIAGLLSAAGTLRISVDTHTIGLLPEDHPVRRDSDWVERRLGNYTPLEFIVQAPRGPADPEFLAALGEWRRRAEQVPGVTRTFTALDIAASPPAETTASDERSPYVRADELALRVTAYVPMGTAREFERAAVRLEREGTAVFGSDRAVRASGYLPLYVRIIDYVVESTIRGLGVAFLIVFVLIALLVRSWLGMRAAVIANVLPVAAVFGVMGWFGIPLDIATATVGAIVLGIVVDDTIHLLFRYRHSRESGAASADAAAFAVREAGAAMTISTLVLAGGFAVMIAAGTRSIAYFGLVATIAIVGAYLADMLLLPVLLGSRSREPAAVTPADGRAAAGSRE